jgi:hypothetical protein
MRFWVCLLNSLLVLASAVILRSKSHGAHDILLSQIRNSPNTEGQVPVVLNYNSDSLYSRPGCHVVSKAFSMSKNTAAVDILILKFREI